MTATADDRNLVTVETISAITPIPDADAIEAATIRGWTVVVKQCEFAVGDPVVYFEIDSLLPLDDERFAFLAPRGEKVVDGVRYHRLKTARLRGCYSQGLAVALRQFDAEFLAWCIESSEEMGSAVGVDFDKYLTDALGVVKYEAPPLTGQGDIIGGFPDRLADRTDSERIQNLARAWNTIAAAGPWVPTEKVDGTSLSILRDTDGSVRVCGRTTEIGPGNNLYWNAVRTDDLLDLLDIYSAQGITGIQAEIVGEGIQKNPLRIKGHRVLVFSVLSGRTHLPREQWPAALIDLAVPVYDLPFPASPDEALAQVDGIKSLVAPERLAEGVVWHQADGRTLPELGYRSTMKAINNTFLLKVGG